MKSKRLAPSFVVVVATAAVGACYDTKADTDPVVIVNPPPPVWLYQCPPTVPEEGSYCQASEACIYFPCGSLGPRLVASCSDYEWSLSDDDCAGAGGNGGTGGAPGAGGG